MNYQTPNSRPTSGHAAPLRRQRHVPDSIATLRRIAKFYRKVLGPYIRQRPCLDAVVAGDADVAAIDGYAVDLLRRHDSGATAQIRVVETTAPAPSPPLVASAGIDAAARERLIEALVGAHRAAEARLLLDDVLLLRFDRVSPGDFEIFLERERAARDAGYPKLA